MLLVILVIMVIRILKTSHLKKWRTNLQCRLQTVEIILPQPQIAVKSEFDFEEMSSFFGVKGFEKHLLFNAFATAKSTANSLLTGSLF